jgi:hypothetical protein
MTMDPAATERRRQPRLEVRSGLECKLEARTRVRLVDISLSGALLASEAPLPVGTRAHLNAGVAATPFSPEVQVQRTLDDEGGRGRLQGLGAVFVEMDDQSRRNLEAFLRKASE